MRRYGRWSQMRQHGARVARRWAAMCRTTERPRCADLHDATRRISRDPAGRRRRRSTIRPAGARRPYDDAGWHRAAGTVVDNDLTEGARSACRPSCSRTRYQAHTRGRRRSGTRRRRLRPVELTWPRTAVGFSAHRGGRGDRRRGPGGRRARCWRKHGDAATTGEGVTVMVSAWAYTTIVSEPRWGDRLNGGPGCASHAWGGVVPGRRYAALHRLTGTTLVDRFCYVRCTRERDGDGGRERASRRSRSPRSGPCP